MFFHTILFCSFVILVLSDDKCQSPLGGIHVPRDLVPQQGYNNQYWFWDSILYSSNDVYHYSVAWTQDTYEPAPVFMFTLTSSTVNYHLLSKVFDPNSFVFQPPFTMKVVVPEHNVSFSYSSATPGELNSIAYLEFSNSDFSLSLVQTQVSVPFYYGDLFGPNRGRVNVNNDDTPTLCNYEYYVALPVFNHVGTINSIPVTGQSYFERQLSVFSRDNRNIQAWNWVFAVIGDQQFGSTCSYPPTKNNTHQCTLNVCSSGNNTDCDRDHVTYEYLSSPEPYPMKAIIHSEKFGQFLIDLRSTNSNVVPQYTEGFIYFTQMSTGLVGLLSVCLKTVTIQTTFYIKMAPSKKERKEATKIKKQQRKDREMKVKQFYRVTLKPNNMEQVQTIRKRIIELGPDHQHWKLQPPYDHIQHSRAELVDELFQAIPELESQGLTEFFV